MKKEKEKRWWKYAWDGKCFFAKATSLNNFRDIMNRNSQYNRYSTQFLKAHDAQEQEPAGMAKLIADEMVNNNFEGVWVHKFFERQNFGHLLEVEGMGDEFTLIRLDELTELKSAKDHKIFMENRNLKDTLAKIRQLTEVWGEDIRNSSQD